MAPSQPQALVPAPCRVILNTGEWLQGTAGWVMVKGAHTGHPWFCQVNLLGFPLQAVIHICMYIYIYVYIYIIIHPPEKPAGAHLCLIHLLLTTEGALGLQAHKTEAIYVAHSDLQRVFVAH